MAAKKKVTKKKATAQKKAPKKKASKKKASKKDSSKADESSEEAGDDSRDAELDAYCKKMRSSKLKDQLRAQVHKRQGDSAYGKAIKRELERRGE